MGQDPVYHFAGWGPIPAGRTDMIPAEGFCNHADRIVNICQNIAPHSGLLCPLRYRKAPETISVVGRSGSGFKGSSKLRPYLAASLKGCKSRPDTNMHLLLINGIWLRLRLPMVQELLPRNISGQSLPQNQPEVQLPQLPDPSSGPRGGRSIIPRSPSTMPCKPGQ